MAELQDWRSHTVQFQPFVEHLVNPATAISGQFDKFDKQYMQNRLLQGKQLPSMVCVHSIVHINDVVSSCNLPLISSTTL